MRREVRGTRALGGPLLLFVLASACNALTGASELAIGPAPADAPDAARTATDAAPPLDAPAGDAPSPPTDAAVEADAAPCQPVTTPFERGTVATSGSNIVGSWTATSKALVADGTPSQLVFNLPNKASPLLEVRGFGFAIPASASIVGVSVRVLRFGNLVQITDDTVRLLAAAPLGDSRAAAMGWPTSLQSREYGTVEDTWGAALTPAIVNASSFGVGLSVIFPMAVGGGPIAFVDEITAAVTYCP
jgi:hypothetical protein